MKVGKLISDLQLYDPEDLVVMSSDGEGNSYSPLYRVDTGVYVPDSTWSGNIYLAPEDLTDEMREFGFCEDDVRKVDDNNKKAVVLIPTN